MILFYFLMIFALGSAQDTTIIKMLDRLQSGFDIINLRLARIEARQTTHEILNTRMENKVDTLQSKVQSNHAESMLWLRNTVQLLAALKSTEDDLKNGQSEINTQLQDLFNQTEDCCRSNKVTCLSTTILPITTPPVPSLATSPVLAPQDCRTIDRQGVLKEGIYQLNTENNVFDVFCSKGYVTLQRRFDGSVKFERKFVEYENGFGFTSGEHWLGLKYQHLMTKDKVCTFRVSLDVDVALDQCDARYPEDCDGKTKQIVADGFRVSSAADMYRINITFNRSDFLSPDVKWHFIFSGQQFTTYDSDNDNWDLNCANQSSEKGGGFWYDRCSPGYPNEAVRGGIICSRSGNKVCGWWFPYKFTSSWMQFMC